MIEAAACVESCDVPEPETVTVPAVPLDTYPALTVGVTDFDPLTVAVMRPFESTEIVGFAVMLVAGVVALPLVTLFDAADA